MNINLNKNEFHQFKNGDEKIFEFIFKSHYNQIVGFCAHFIHDQDKANSIAQEVFVKLWLNKNKVRKTTGIVSFLYTAAKSECLNLLRHQKVVYRYQDQYIQKREESLNLEVLNSMIFDPVSLFELEQLIDSSIEKLPEKCKYVFIGRFLHHKKNKEIAKELNITVKAVEANMTRALKSLRHSLSDFIPTFLVWMILGNF